jgi:hypothetical protein
MRCGARSPGGDVWHGRRHNTVIQSRTRGAAGTLRPPWRRGMRSVRARDLSAVGSPGADLFRAGQAILLAELYANGWSVK